MANAFDFELVANDQVSDVITRIDDAVRKLTPVLQSTKDDLALGGQDTSDGLDGISDRLNGMSRAARDNVQFIGDMVPPLKMVGELGSKLGSSLGVAGAVAYGIKQVSYSLNDAAKEAYNLDVSAKNAGMRVEEFSRLSGAMQILGSDSQSANASIEAMFKTFNDAASGRNAGALSAMVQIGAQIEKNRDGSVNVLKTLESIARVFPSLRPEQQKTAAEALGLDENGLQLLREGVRLKELLSKSDEFGLTVNPEFNKRLTEANNQMNELWARYEGLKNQGKNKLLEYMLPDEKQTSALNDARTYDGSQFYHGDREKDIRWQALRDKEFTSSLSFSERLNFTLNRPDSEVEKKLNARYGAMWQAHQLRDDLSAATFPQQNTPNRGDIPYSQAKNNAIGLRNRNPGNVRDAPNSLGKNGGFSVFANDDDGLSAMARQLMLYGDRGNNTPSGIIHTYAPKSENKTKSYIESVSKTTGFTADERLNLHDPEVLKPLMAAMVKHENGTQPFSEEKLSNAIQTAIMDDRWKGLRRPEVLAQQRNNIISGNDRAVTREVTTQVIQPPESVPYREERTKPDVVGHGIAPSNDIPSVSDMAKREVFIPAERSKVPVEPMVDTVKREESTPAIQPALVQYSSTNIENNATSPAIVKVPEERNVSVFSEQQVKTDDRSLTENLANSLKDVMTEQKIKLEITMVNDKGEKKTYNVMNNGRITTPINY